MYPSFASKKRKVVRSNPHRTIDLTHLPDAALPSKLRADLPVLFLYGTEDPTCSPVAVQNMGNFVDELSVVPMSGIGHWIMLEVPQTVTEAILKWLKSALDPKAAARL